jgi:hypothetical protein
MLPAHGMRNEMAKTSKEADGIICSTSEKDVEGEVKGTIALLENPKRKSSSPIVSNMNSSDLGV